MTNKKIILPILVVFVAGVSILGLSKTVNAQSGNSHYSGLVEAIAQKFGLDKTQVQSVADQYVQQQQANKQQRMQQRLEDKLSQLVKDGKITESQKQAIINEFSTLKTKYNPESLKNMTPEQRRQAMQKEQDELKAWAQSQGIDLSNLMTGFGMKGMGLEGRGMHGRGWYNQTTPTITPTPSR